MPANFADLLSTEVTPDKDFRFFGQLHAHFERLGQEVDGQRENLAKIQVRLCYIMTPLLLVLIYNWFFGTPTNELYAMSFALSITVIAQLGLNIDNRPSSPPGSSEQMVTTSCNNWMKCSYQICDLMITESVKLEYP